MILFWNLEKPAHSMGFRPLIHDIPVPIALWPDVATEALPEKVCHTFELRREAIRQYFDGVPVNDIQAATGVSRFQLAKMARQCLSYAADGNIYGYRALVPFSRTRNYVRRKEEAPKRREQQGGQSGLLNAMLDQDPDLAELLAKTVRTQGKRGAPRKLSALGLHQTFINYLETQNYSKKHWPFTTKHLGYRTISRYMQSVRDSHLAETVNNLGNAEARAHINVGTGHPKFLLYEEEPYDAVEIGAHRIDAHLTVAIRTPEGDETDVLLQRLWLIAAVDRRTSAVLAHTIVYRSEVTSDDVLRVIRKAATQKWAPIPDLPSWCRYKEGAGLPSGLMEEAHGAVWSMTYLDSALAHLSNAVRERARRILGYIVHWGPTAHFEHRPNIERTFCAISADIFHLLPSTTGSSPTKGRARNAEKNAIELRVRASDCEILTDVYFANHNVMPSEGKYNRSPLEVISYYLAGSPPRCLPRKLPQSNFDSAKTVACRVLLTVRGSREDGRRPYVQIDRVKYTSPVLADCPALIGRKLIVDIDEEDMRCVKAYLENGDELGFLTPNGPWGITKHSRRDRKAINSLISRRVLVLAADQNPVVAYVESLTTTKVKEKSKRPLLSPRQATEVARLAKDTGLPMQITYPQKTIKTKSISDFKNEPSIISEQRMTRFKIRNRG